MINLEYEYGRIENGKIINFTLYKGGLLLDGNVVYNPSEVAMNKAGWYKIIEIEEDGVTHIEGNKILSYIGSQSFIEIEEDEHIQEVVTEENN